MRPPRLRGSFTPTRLDNNSTPFGVAGASGAHYPGLTPGVINRLSPSGYAVRWRYIILVSEVNIDVSTNEAIVFLCALRVLRVSFTPTRSTTNNSTPFGVAGASGVHYPGLTPGVINRLSPSGYAVRWRYIILISEVNIDVSTTEAIVFPCALRVLCG